ncbi:hypothetical protein L873DRAFT_1194094 [Choiromyces venosus 120613-1]|uniref:Uncharacterized protein n=1 Tax=Choiromyces venosus 120613-1 TaxID=1336337 RepID=A0A3N4JES0_9PEZI|nr:hypothetical protein L873DRAFT_1194094 [Choiromyces venosus 120613-1]
MGVNGIPKASEKLTDREVRFLKKKPNQKTSKPLRSQPTKTQPSHDRSSSSGAPQHLVDTRAHRLRTSHPTTSQVPPANHKTTPYTTPPRNNRSNNHSSFMGVNSIPKASEKLTDREVRFLKKKPNQKTPKARGPKHKPADRERTGSKKTQRPRPKSHSRQKTKPTPGRKVGKPKNSSNLETRVCPNGRSNEQTRRGKAKRQVPYDQLYPGQQNERIPNKEV